MKKFCIKAVSMAAASVCASTAFAGTIVAPTASTKYAVESLASGTDLTLPGLTYTMGVGRTTAQDFTVIIKPSNSATNKFTAASCNDALLAFAVTGGGAATASLKRADPTECAYEIDVTTAFVANATNLTFGGAAGQNFVLDSHGLATAGTTVNLDLGIWELAENARIDNTTDKSVAVANSGNALTLTAAADTLTKADVNDEQGPLFGFVSEGTAPSDADATARAAFVVGNNSGATVWMKPDGATAWDFTVDGTKITVTVAGNFQGLATNGFIVTPPVGAVGALTAVTGASTTAVFELEPADISAGQTNSTIVTTFTSARTASLGTSRTFGVSAVGDVVTGADVTLSGNTTWWTWGANASQLMTPYFTTNASFLSRYFFLNYRATAVNYTATCYSEGGAITYGVKQTGTLIANGQTAVNAADVCTIDGATRGGVIFTINAPINAVKANYQTVDPVTLNNMVVPMTRPYNNANTTE